MLGLALLDCHEVHNCSLDVSLSHFIERLLAVHSGLAFGGQNDIETEGFRVLVWDGGKPAFEVFCQFHCALNRLTVADKCCHIKEKQYGLLRDRNLSPIDQVVEGKE